MVVANDPTSYRPCLVVAHADPLYAARVSRAFRRLGWDVYPAKTGPETRRLARLLEAEVVLLDVHLGDESGWLTCAKLHSERPGTWVVLVGDPSQHERAQFVGARFLVAPTEDVTAVVGKLAFRPAA